jgi:hypothetical protein
MYSIGKLLTGIQIIMIQNFEIDILRHQGINTTLCPSVTRLSYGSIIPGRLFVIQRSVFEF